MLQIRRGIFETNSSSVHAITVSKDISDAEYCRYINFGVGNFGWRHRKYFDTTDKAAYLWTAILSNFEKYHKEDHYYDGFNERYYRVYIDDPKYLGIKSAIVSALKSFGLEEENITFEQYFKIDALGNFECGYIDHCPGMDFINELVFNRRRLINYLFNENSIITTWNDNEWFLKEGKEIDYSKPWAEELWKYFDIPENTEWKYLKQN